MDLSRLTDQDELAMEENGKLVNGHMEHDNFDDISNAKVGLETEKEEVAFAQKRFDRDTNRKRK